MTTFHVRSHEFGPDKPRQRIWDQEMQGYGQFNIVDFDDVVKLKEALDKTGMGNIQVHHCDTISECNCPIISREQYIEEYLR